MKLPIGPMKWTLYFFSFIFIVSFISVSTRALEFGFPDVMTPDPLTDVLSSESFRINVSGENIVNSSVYVNFTVTANYSVLDQSSFISGEWDPTVPEYMTVDTSDGLNITFLAQPSHIKLFPGTFDIPDAYFSNTSTTWIGQSNNRERFAIQFYNFTTTPQTEYDFMFVSQNTSGAPIGNDLSVYYCNSTHITDGSKPPASNNCALAGTVTPNTPYVSHGVGDNMYELRFSSDGNSKFSGVQISDTSYMVLVDPNVVNNIWNHASVPIDSQSVYYSNDTLSYAVQTYTIDAHVHFFRNDTVLTRLYYAENTTHSLISTPFSDPIFLSQLPPTSVSVLVPGTNTVVSGSLIALWVDSSDVNLDPFNYSIYMGDYLFADKNITNGTITFAIDTTSVPDADYSFIMNACDEFGCSTNTTVNFTVDNIPDPPTLSNLVLNSTVSSNLTAENLTVFFDMNPFTGFPDTNITDWRNNGTSFGFLNLPFDTNISGSGTIQDYSTYSLNGTLHGPTWNSAGVIGGAYTFNGISDYMDFGNDNAFNIGSAWTITMWINRADTAGNYEALFFKGVPTNWTYGAWIGLGTSQKLMFATYFNGTYVQNTVLSPAISTGTWTFIVLRFDGTNIEPFVNGNQGPTMFVGGIPDGSSNNFYLGSRANLDQYFMGMEDDVHMYNRTLTDVQINETYNAGLEGHSVQRVVRRETNLGETWSVAVTPNDMFQDGLTYVSSDYLIRNSPPTITFPTANIVLNSSINLNWTEGTTPNSDALTSSLYLNNILLADNNLSGVSTFLLDTTSVDDGAYLMIMNSCDAAAGVCSDNSTVNFSISNIPDQPPSAPTIVAPAANEVINSTYNVNWVEGTDINNDSFNTFIYVGTNLVIDNILNGTQTYALNTLVFDDGVYLLTMGSCDNTGCSANSTQNFSIMNVPPDPPTAPTITTPAANEIINSTYNVNWIQGTDIHNLSFTSSLYFGTFLLADNNISSGIQTFPVNTLSFDDDVYSLTMNSCDVYGCSANTTVNFSINNVPQDPPTALSITTPTANEVINSTYNINWVEGTDINNDTFNTFIYVGTNLVVNNVLNGTQTYALNTLVFDDGDYLLTMGSCDTYACSPNVTQNFSIMNVPPDPPATPTITSPVPNAVINGVYDFNWTDGTDIHNLSFTLSFYIDGILFADNNISNGTQTFSVDTLMVSDGAYLMTLGACGVYGCSANATVNFSILNVPEQPPTAPTIITPPANAVINSTYDVNWTEGTDINNDTFSTFIYVGTNLVIDNILNGTQTYALNTLLFDDGAYLMTMGSCDLYACSPNTTVNFSINNVPQDPPTTPTITSPAVNEVVNGSINFNWTEGTDINNDSFTSSLYIDGLLFADNNISNGTQTFIVDTTSIDDGTYLMTMGSCDAFACGPNTTRNFSIMNVPPDSPTAPIVIAPATNAIINSTYNINWVEGTDIHNTSFTYSLYVGTALLSSSIPSGTQIYSLNTLLFDDGVYLLTMDSCNAYGCSANSTVNFSINNVPQDPPTALTIVNPSANEIINSTYNVNWIDGTDINNDTFNTFIYVGTNLVVNNVLNGTQTYALNTLVFDDGDYLLTMGSCDTYACSPNVTQNFSINNVPQDPPVAPTILTPTPDQIAEGNFTITWIDGADINNDSFTVWIKLDTTILANDIPNGTQTFTFNTTSFPDDIYTLAIYACDAYACGPNSSVGFKILNGVDEVPTSPTITSPSANDVINGTYNINWIEGFDPDNESFTSVIYIDDVLAASNIPNGTQTYALNTLLFDDGAHWLSMYSCDEFFCGINDTINISISNVPQDPPTSPIIMNPIENTTVSGLIGISWVEGTDINNDSFTSSIYVGDTIFADNNISNGVQAFLFDTTSIADGTYPLTMYSCDAYACSANTTIQFTITNAVSHGGGGGGSSRTANVTVAVCNLTLSTGAPIPYTTALLSLSNQSISLTGPITTTDLPSVVGSKIVSNAPSVGILMLLILGGLTFTYYRKIKELEAPRERKRLRL